VLRLRWSKGLRNRITELRPRDFYIVEFSGPVLKSRRDELQAFGVSLLEQLAPSRFTARLNVSQLRVVQQLPDAVRGVRLYKETVSGAAMPKGTPGGCPGGGRPGGADSAAGGPLRPASAPCAGSRLCTRLAGGQSGSCGRCGRAQGACSSVRGLSTAQRPGAAARGSGC
jgi:hypothetical protein